MTLTIVDVAKEAGVSSATVSRVMNGNYPVKEETRKKVLQAIEKLKFIPNMQARELTMKQSTIIGVIVPSINNMFFPEVVNGIEKQLKEYDYSFILSCTCDNSSEEKRCINNFLSRNVAGIIVVDPSTENIEDKFYDNISGFMPIVFINGYSNVKNVSSVSNDEAEGASAAIDYLIDKGRKNILFVRGDGSYSYDIKEKVYIDKMNSIDSFNEDNIINIGSGNGTETVDNTEKILKEVLAIRKVDAVFCCNDLMACGVLNACNSLNIKIKDDVSIIGFDNIDLSRFVSPKLTTMDQNMDLLGINAAMLLVEKINCDNQYSKKVLLDNKMVIRETA
ncbi:LacI family DNA-binding transcriptional regulator [Inconstantimicrobium porci]|uniref:LacI family transcriptional regulator n=1 Tax=Inconstantimicrobium porci TaxID=2652291 RepID=A0A7X2MXT9_9CLOT|nr:LacI family DNA-binding transcriptional regulator [Inconstantimicrobium porci]MSR91054.1 LacI family transcriptional regulator [Inconstantimicrobium porci]